MNIKRLALMSCVAMSAVMAVATGAFADGRGLFNAADTNKDGVVDQSEFQAARDKWFADIDTNKDGFITVDELKAFGEKMRAQWMQKHADAANAAPAGAPPPQPNGDRADRMAEHMLQRIDTNHDGKISKAEFDAESAALFKRLDKNGDGKIETAEIPAHRWGRPGEMGQLGMRMFDRWDANGDGKVTMAEFTTAEDRMFQRLDKNGDGILTRDEVQAFRPHGHWHGPDGGPVPLMPAPGGDDSGAPAPDQAPDQAPTP